MDVNIDRSDQSVDKVALKNKLTGNQVGCGKLAAGECFSATQPIARRTYIGEDELMIKAYNEFMSYPLSERDEAVKMLAWRLI